jgi:hypothetical protein
VSNKYKISDEIYQEIKEESKKEILMVLVSLGILNYNMLDDVYFVIKNEVYKEIYKPLKSKK